MKETILLFNPPEKADLLKIEMALFPLRIRLKKIGKEDYSQPLGVLAGMKDIAPCEEQYDGPELPGTMFVFCFLSDSISDLHEDSAFLIVRQYARKWNHISRCSYNIW